MARRRALFVLGTRPEAIKLCPVIHAAAALEARVCVTGQHRALVAQALAVFGVAADCDLDVMVPAQTLAGLTARILERLEPVLAAEAPGIVVVQGDTTTTFAASLAAFYAGIPVAHVEAGLRTGDLGQPFPEEANRVLTTRLAALHFAPTGGARANLLAEGVAEAGVFVTGNTGVDAVLHIAGALAAGALQPRTRFPVPPGRRLLAVTAHRRESFGAPLRAICAAVAQLAARPDVHVVWPVHPNPQVGAVVSARLRACPNVTLAEPLDYVDFVDLMRNAALLITDSGGVQEEAPSLGKPVIVLRDKTERPEGVAAGTVELAGPHAAAICAAAARLLDDPAEYRRRTAIHNPYGDGNASPRIVDAIDRFLAGRLPMPASRIPSDSSYKQ